VCPYRGLLPYDVEDGDSFFGRDQDVADCLERLRHEGVLAVLGPSGTGKSSLVRAGIVAALRRDGQVVDVVTPGAHPADAVPPPRAGDASRTLVVDQAEEAFSLCRDPEELELFLRRLSDHASRAPLALALRADRMGEVSSHPEQVAVGGENGEVALMDVRTGATISTTLAAHPVSTAWIAWSPDGSRFVSTGSGGTVSLWDGHTGELLGTITNPEQVLSNAAFVDNADTVVVVTYTDGLYVWDTSHRHAVEFACAAAGRELSEAEWRQWFGSRPFRPTCPDG
jgi:hypothetical protein